MTNSDLTPVRAHWFILFLLVNSFFIQAFLFTKPLAVVLLTGQILSLLLPMMAFLAWRGGYFFDRLSLGAAKWGHFLGGAVIITVMQPFFMIFAAVVEAFVGNPMTPVLDQIFAEPMWVVILGLVVGPAIIEELVFRGYLLSGYRQLPLWRAAALSGAVFGLFHMNLYQFSFAFLLGALFAVVTRQSGSVFPAIFMHMVNNLISVAAWYLKDTGPLTAADNYLKGVTGSVQSGAVGALIAALSLLLGLVLLKWIFFRAESGSQSRASGDTAAVPAYGVDWPLAIMLTLFMVFVMSGT